MPDNRQQPEAVTIVVVDLFNPTRARRVIYDGIGETPKCIVIESGETKRGIRLNRDVADELRERNRVKKDSDLVIQKPEAHAA